MTATTTTNGDVKGFTYKREYLGKGRKIRIIVIGAGIAGIGAVKIFKDTFPERDVELVIYEKNADVTGTWLENRYPGCACDIPAHVYTYSWEGNPRWSRAYAGSLELYEYFKGRAEAYGVDEFLHLQHQVSHAAWDDKVGKWVVQIKDLRNGSVIEDSAEILINAGGFLNSWKWPEIPGLHDFKGKLMHSAAWDTDYDFENKTVVVIGSGSSAVQIVPELQPKVKHMFSINRSKTWIIPKFSEEYAPEGPGALFTEAQKVRWENNPDEFLEYRKQVESSIHTGFEMFYRESPLQAAAVEACSKTMRERLNNDPELIKKLVPDFEVGCRRPTPGHGYLEALSSSNVTVLTHGIRSVNESGVEMTDGSHLKVDAIICATGFDTTFRPTFPLIAFDQNLRELWKDEPTSYLSIAAAGMPNYFMMSGPNFPLSNGAGIASLEHNIKYAFAVAKKIQHDDLHWVAPKQDAVRDFQEYKDAIMDDMVWTGPCTSWYKNGKRDGKVWGPWPGSSLHYFEIIGSPRWEDYEIKYRNQNRFAFFGNGRTKRQIEGGDLAYYLSQPGAVNSKL
ncbi:hypothetical protein NX059_007942 [Plenodomus lindquistii]|nr:hypothetical protein NX059_007942 [Plenodomus lindquistii]